MVRPWRDGAERLEFEQPLTTSIPTGVLVGAEWQ